MRVALVYNEPQRLHSEVVGEEKSALAVLEAVEAVYRALLELDFDVAPVPLLPPLEQAEAELRNLDTDLVFNLFEGFCDYPETEPVIPEILSEMGVPFTGCPGPVLRLALDKAKTKLILTAAGIKTPDFQLLNPKTLDMFRLGYPCIVKPRCDDASNGLSVESVVHDFLALERQVSRICDSHSGNALVSEFLPGREFNATVMGNSELTALPVSEIVYSLPPGMPEILTFDAKWEDDSIYFEGTKPVCPAEIADEEQHHIAETITKVYRLLGCRGYARVDMRLDQEGELNIIEVNPNPDISPGTGAVRQAAAAGMAYTKFVEKIVQLALDRKDYEDRYPTYVPRRQAPRSRNTARHTRIQTF
ncbi:MAG: ATP-grasp domain-containing protein [Dehalococcoidia bacterium]|nr:ATP-grasp domain-containing protein [Dehalococcoidia bacterium]